MINLNQWLYSRDIAKWLTNQKPLSVTAQTDCICPDPHRTLQEKESWLGELSDLIKMDKSRLRTILSDRKPKEISDPDKLRMQYVKELAIRTKQSRTGC